ncbi:MAG: 3-dehydroquinate synthase [Planctomycetota bacterium]
MNAIHQRFSVESAYDVVFTRAVFAEDNHCLAGLMRGEADARPTRALVCIDAGVARARPTIATTVTDWFVAHQAAGLRLAATPAVLPGGEAAKADLSVVDQVGQMAAEANICRHSYILAVGGGAMLDAVGLAASLIHRGVRLIRIPTTVLAQNDSGVGVKNGVNACGQKNFFGTFAPPHAVVNDAGFLTTLADRDWRAGIAEAYKVALIKDGDFLAWLLAHTAELAARELETMAALIARCAGLHCAHIATGGDPFERGSSRPLDFGHWSAHRLESLTRHRLNHGEAVAIGIALDLLYAVRLGAFPAAACSLVLEAFAGLGFALWDPALDLRGSDDRRLLLDGLEQFRAHLGGELTLAMPAGIGQRQDVHELDPALVGSALDDLRAFASAPRYSTEPRRG